MLSKMEPAIAAYGVQICQCNKTMTETEFEIENDRGSLKAGWEWHLYEFNKGEWANK